VARQALAYAIAPLICMQSMIEEARPRHMITPSSTITTAITSTASSSTLTAVVLTPPDTTSDGNDDVALGAELGLALGQPLLQDHQQNISTSRHHHNNGHASQPLSLFDLCDVVCPLCEPLLHHHTPNDNDGNKSGAQVTISSSVLPSSYVDLDIISKFFAPLLETLSTTTTATIVAGSNSIEHANLGVHTNDMNRLSSMTARQSMTLSWFRALRHVDPDHLRRVAAKASSLHRLKLSPSTSSYIKQASNYDTHTGTIQSNEIAVRCLELLVDSDRKVREAASDGIALLLFMGHQYSNSPLFILFGNDRDTSTMHIHICCMHHPSLDLFASLHTTLFSWCYDK
jgi:hypothetical protein